MGYFHSADVRQLLHNKFVVVLGDSIQRSVYKDLVKLLQNDKFLSEAQLKRKGEMTFENDTLVEGGCLGKMCNETTFREVRQYRTGHHLVRFYFLTRVYSAYLESVLSDFRSGPQPDVLIVNSCVWDLMRYDDRKLEAYKNNLDRLFQRLQQVLQPQCLVIWNMTMPVGYRENELPEYTARNLRLDIVEGNFFSATIATLYKLDVLDMHYHFRCHLRLRCRDAVHWNQVAHRKYTQILLAHIAQAWGVAPPEGNMMEGAAGNVVPPQSVVIKNLRKLRPTMPERARCSPGPVYISGYTSFEGSGASAMPGVECPGYHTAETPSRSDADSPFVTDGPLLTPGYFPPPPGPAEFPSHPFAGREFVVPDLLPPMNITPFPHRAPYLHEVQNMKMSRRTARPRGGWAHPYPRPPAYLPGIY